MIALPQYVVPPRRDKLLVPGFAFAKKNDTLSRIALDHFVIPLGLPATAG